MRRAQLRATAVGAALGALAFALLGLYLNRAVGAALFSNAGPVAILALIGATVGGLVAPLVASWKEGR